MNTRAIPITAELDLAMRMAPPCAAVVDAGLGGLTVIGNIVRRRKDLNLLYIADSRNMPYSTRGNTWICQRAQRLVDVAGLYVNDIVLGCHTISTFVQHLRSRATIRGIIEPTVGWLRSNIIADTLIIIGTPTTVNSGVYEGVLDNVRILRVPCLKLATTIERSGLRSAAIRNCIEAEICRAIPATKSRRVAILLGCTHYSLIADVLCAILREYLNPEELQMVDPSEIFGNSLPLSEFPCGQGHIIACINDDRARHSAERLSEFMNRVQIENYQVHFMNLL